MIFQPKVDSELFLLDTGIRAAVSNTLRKFSLGNKDEDDRHSDSSTEVKHSTSSPACCRFE